MSDQQKTDQQAQEAGGKQQHDSLTRFKRNRLAIFGAAIVFVLIVLAVFPGPFMPHDPTKTSLENARTPPSREFLLGTDALGRDILSRVVASTRVAFTVAFSSVLIGLFVGTLVGTIAGYVGGIVDTVIMRGVDVVLSFPYLLFAIAIIAILGPGLLNTIVALAFYSTPQFARLARGSVISIREREYAEAARALGCSHIRIMFRHLVPNFLSPIIVYTSLFSAQALRMEAGLSFLGLGVQPPFPSWGLMISAGRDYLRTAPHISTMPGLAIMLAVLGFNLLGDGLRDALDPKMSDIESE